MKVLASYLALTMNTMEFEQAETKTLEEARQELAGIFKYEQDDLCEDDSPITHKALALLVTFPDLAFEEFEASEELSYKFLPLSIFIASGAQLGVIAVLHKLNPAAVKARHPVLKLYVSFPTRCQMVCV